MKRILMPTQLPMQLPIQPVSYRIGVFILSFSLLLSGCAKISKKELSVRPDVVLTPSETEDLVGALSQQFPKRGVSVPWSSELTFGWAFAREGDFYRAITCFRKTLMYLDALYPSEEKPSSGWQNQVRVEAVTGIISSYTLQKKYEHAVEAWDSLGDQLSLAERREAKWLLVMMVQALSSRREHEERAVQLASMLPQEDPDRLALLCYLAVRAQNPSILAQSGVVPLMKQTEDLFTRWKAGKKDPSLALGMNLVLPGSGYAYLGQWPTAFTSLTINALFIGACIEFFRAHQPMAALITLGLEVGWWVGGATGARLLAYEYNHRLWLDMAKKFMRDNSMYPEAVLWRSLLPERKELPPALLPPKGEVEEQQTETA